MLVLNENLIYVEVLGVLVVLGMLVYVEVNVGHVEVNVGLC